MSEETLKSGDWLIRRIPARFQGEQPVYECRVIGALPPFADIVGHGSSPVYAAKDYNAGCWNRHYWIEEAKRKAERQIKAAARKPGEAKWWQFWRRPPNTQTSRVAPLSASPQTSDDGPGMHPTSISKDQTP